MLMSAAIAKMCTVCGQDVSGQKRTKDPHGRYYCEPCWKAAVAEHQARQRQPVDELPVLEPLEELPVLEPLEENPVLEPLEELPELAGDSLDAPPLPLMPAMPLGMAPPSLPPRVQAPTLPRGGFPLAASSRGAAAASGPSVMHRVPV
jgi:hypothetical protein